MYHARAAATLLHERHAILVRDQQRLYDTIIHKTLGLGWWKIRCVWPLQRARSTPDTRSGGWTPTLPMNTATVATAAAAAARLRGGGWGDFVMQLPSTGTRYQVCSFDGKHRENRKDRKMVR